MEKLLTLVGDFCTAHPRSKLPAACETAMEFAKSLCEKPDTRMLRDYGRQVVSVVDALCAMFCQVRNLGRNLGEFGGSFAVFWHVRRCAKGGWNAPRQYPLPTATLLTALPPAMRLHTSPLRNRC